VISVSCKPIFSKYLNELIFINVSIIHKICKSIKVVEKKYKTVFLYITTTTNKSVLKIKEINEKIKNT